MSFQTHAPLIYFLENSIVIVEQLMISYHLPLQKKMSDEPGE